MSIDEAIKQYQAVTEKLAGTLGEQAQKEAIPVAEKLANNPYLSHRVREVLRWQLNELKAKGVG